MGASQSCHGASERSSGMKTDMVQVSLDNMRPIVATLLDRCQVSFEIKPYDQALHGECFAVAKERGYPVDTDPNVPSLPASFPTGIYFASFPYAHLTHSARVFIALYSTFMTYLDDLDKRDLSKVMLFQSRLIRHEKQDDPVLDCFAQFLDETDQHFDRIAANLIVTETLTYTNSLILDHEVDGLKISKNAVGLASTLRLISGITFPYTMFIFPAEIPVKKYIQAIPEMRNFICYLKYKISVLASLASDVAKSNETIKALLREEPDALHAWENFVRGYVCAHVSDSRYKLDRLGL